jgi:hypothetical protein
MPKLNQVVAVVPGKKSDSEKAITAVYHKVQKDALFQGISRTYSPLKDDGEVLPPERKLLQYRVSDAIRELEEALTPLFDTVFTQDVGNTEAKADIVVDGKTIASGVPVTYLLFLEKKMADLHTFVSKLPTLDPATTWNYSADADSYASDKTWRYHTQKIPKTLKLAEATDKHPAQVQVFTEDVNVGKWETINFSGAIPAKDQHQMLVRVKALLEAIKKAREEANSIEVKAVKVAGPILDFVFGA